MLPWIMISLPHLHVPLNATFRGRCQQIERHPAHPVYVHPINKKHQCKRATITKGRRPLLFISATDESLGPPEITCPHRAISGRCGLCWWLGWLLAHSGTFKISSLSGRRWGPTVQHVVRSEQWCVFLVVSRSKACYMVWFAIVDCRFDASFSLLRNGSDATPGGSRPVWYTSLRLCSQYSSAGCLNQRLEVLRSQNFLASWMSR